MLWSPHCRHTRGKRNIRLKLARLDSLSWTTVQWVSAAAVAAAHARAHTRTMTKACPNLHFRLIASGSREVGLWSSDPENTLQPNTCGRDQMGWQEHTQGPRHSCIIAVECTMSNADNLRFSDTCVKNNQLEDQACCTWSIALNVVTIECAKIF